jgi:hypothetical protein
VVKDVFEANPHTELQWDYHIDICTSDGYNARRHNDAQTAIQQETARLGDSSGPGLYTDLLFPGIAGRRKMQALVIDLSFCNPSAISNLASDQSQPLAAASEREAERIKKYEVPSNALNLDFRPVVIETTGALGTSARDFIAIVLANATTITEESMSSNKYTRFLQVLIATLFRSIGNKFVAAKGVHSGDRTFTLSSSANHYSYNTRCVSHH